jgi:hypothetical protein
MLKMLLDPMGGIVLTNDGHAILREIEVAHPAAKSMIELSRTQVLYEFIHGILLTEVSWSDMFNYRTRRLETEPQL